MKWISKKKLSIYVTESSEDTLESIEITDTEPMILKEDRVKLRRKLWGSILALLSSVIFTANSVIIKKLDINFSDAMVVRYGLQTVAIVATMYILERKKKSTNDEETRKNLVVNKSNVLLLFQGFCNGICVLGEFICVSYMPIGDATSIIFSSPLPSMILSALFLSHNLRLYKITCGLILYLGIIFVVKPPFIFGSNVLITNTGKNGTLPG